MFKRPTVVGNPQIYHFLKRYQDDPQSRVFAPLAEAYRKAGMPREALDIARDGVRMHPHFMGGRVALARALFDLGKYEEVIRELEFVVRDAPDNIIAQRVLAESYLITHRSVAALNCYKMLLYFAPQDEEVARMVTELETKAYEEGALVLEDKVHLAPAPGAGRRSSDGVSKSAWIWKVEQLQGMLLKLSQLKSARLSS